MDLGNLMSFSDHVIGIENDFVKDDSSDMPAGVGECYSLPTEYVKICLEGLNVADDEYMELVQEYTNAVDFTKAGFPTLTSEPALYIHTNSQEGLVLHQSLLVWSNGTALDRYTNKIWIYAHGINAEYRIFYEDSSGDIQYAGNLTGGSRITTKFAHLNYGSLGSSVNLNFLGRRPSSSQSFFNITLTSPLLDNITSIFSTSNGKVNALGALQSWEEPSELVWDDRVNIGTKDEDHRTRFGIVVKDPRSHGASDEVVLGIPSAQVKARVALLTATGLVRNDVPLGSSLTAGGFNPTYIATSLPGLQSASIVYNGITYPVHDELQLTDGGPTIETSLTSQDDDYASGVFLESMRDRIKYYYKFDSPLYLTNATEQNPVIINFLNDRVLIQRIVSPTSFVIGYCGDGTCNIGESRLTCQQDCVSSGSSPLRIKTTAT